MLDRFHVYSDCGATRRQLRDTRLGSLSTVTFLPLYDETPQSIEALTRVFRGPDLDPLMHALSSVLCGAQRAIFHPAMDEAILVGREPLGDSLTVRADETLRYAPRHDEQPDPAFLYLSSLLRDRDIGFLFARCRNRLAARLYEDGRMIATTPVSRRPDSIHGHAIYRALLEDGLLAAPLSELLPHAIAIG